MPFVHEPLPPPTHFSARVYARLFEDGKLCLRSENVYIMNLKGNYRAGAPCSIVRINGPVPIEIVVYLCSNCSRGGISSKISESRGTFSLFAPVNESRETERLMFQFSSSIFDFTTLTKLSPYASITFPPRFAFLLISLDISSALNNNNDLTLKRKKSRISRARMCVDAESEILPIFFIFFIPI